MNSITFPGFGQADFEAMRAEGLEGRMNAIIGTVRPKLEAAGRDLAPVLSRLSGETMTPHVAKHARRSVNPPADTWVAWSRNPRGYKMHPHFQVGIWPTHVFVQFAIIYECPDKGIFAENALREMASVRQTVPGFFVWSKDHMVPEGTRHDGLTDDELAEWLRRLKTVKAAEITCGIHLLRDDPVLASGGKFLRKAEETFQTLLPLYRMAGGV
ncbi:DUF1054 domain-containing protein [Cohnella sp. CFH 77786]|uniref:DUF1054 domain-containing protein n=1 Tax=Cohnella sp. CFH 77786 TaxID=2662265 RepID=UPI002104365E|nr:DUF1054 domain-containing protein [Cohnella sp. CFH 77786]